MRRWQNLAAPDDPGSWHDCDNFYPTTYGTYEIVPPTTNTDSTAYTGAGNVRYAFAAATLSTTVTWIVDSSKIWLKPEIDRTNSVTIGNEPMMAQYGNITVCVMGAANPTVVSTSGGNFAALAGAPQGEIVVVCSNAVMVLNTNASVDGWHVSDVGDYTNWTTGESASGRLISTPGPIVSAVVFADSVIVFKTSGVYRIRYVGGAVKWAVELLHISHGITGSGGYTLGIGLKYCACASPTHVFFLSPGEPRGSTWAAYMMDGAAQFVRVNPLTTIDNTAPYFVRYVKDLDLFCLVGYGVTKAYFYCVSSNAWGRLSTSYDANKAVRPLMGEEPGTSNNNRLPMGFGYYKPAANTISEYAYAAASYSASSGYLETKKAGTPNRKTKFLRVIPLLRKRTDHGTDSAALSATFYREREDTSAQRTEAVTESTQRKRFDFSVTDNFMQARVTWAALEVEVDDFLIDSADAGRD